MTTPTRLFRLGYQDTSHPTAVGGPRHSMRGRVSAEPASAVHQAYAFRILISFC